MMGPETVCLVHMEPVQNSGGAFTAPVAYWQGVRELCDRYDILLSADEVITGFGRIGCWFASERYDIRPDIVTCAKGLSSSYAAIGAVLATERVMEPFLEGSSMYTHGITFGGHPVQCAVALKNIEIMKRERIVEHVRGSEDVFRAKLETLLDLDIVGDVRGAGFFYALEFVRDSETKQTFDDADCEALLRGYLSPAFFDAGLICRADDRGDPVVQISPPLVATETEMDEIVGILGDVCRRRSAGSPQRRRQPSPNRHRGDSRAGGRVSRTPCRSRHRQRRARHDSRRRRSMESGNGTVVVARDVTRRYGEGETAVDALRGVSVDVARGKLTAVMGPSGSGKSTLMHILAGLDKPTSGSVAIAGTEITTLKDSDLTKLRRQHIGFVFQFFNLLPMLNAEENIRLPLAIAGEKPEPAFFEALVKSVGLGDRLSHRPASSLVASSSASRLPVRSSRSRTSCSRTSRPGTSTRRRGPRSWSCCGTRSRHRPDDRDGDPRGARRCDRRPCPLPGRRSHRPRVVGGDTA